MYESEYNLTAELIQQSNSTVYLTGAGMSKSAGIPTFRDRDGLWTKPGALNWANRSTFNADPKIWYERFWKMYLQKRVLAPSVAHLALKSLVDLSAGNCIVTQNVDGLDLASGNDPSRVHEVHGHDRTLFCTQCNYSVDTELWLSSNNPNDLPVCPDQHVLKPAILLFGPDNVPGLAEVQLNAVGAISKASLMLIIGTSLEIPWVAETVLDFRDREGKYIVINPSPTIANHAAEVVLYETAEVALPRLVSLCAKALKAPRNNA